MMTVSEWVEAKGGDLVVAKEYGVGKTAVGNWRSWNRIPDKLHLKVYRDCQLRGIDFDPENPAPDEAAA